MDTDESNAEPSVATRQVFLAECLTPAGDPINRFVHSDRRSAVDILVERTDAPDRKKAVGRWTEDRDEPQIRTSYVKKEARDRGIERGALPRYIRWLKVTEIDYYANE